VSSSRVMPHDQIRLAGLAGRWADAADRVTSLADGPWASVSAEDLAKAGAPLEQLGRLRGPCLAAELAAVIVEARLAVSLERSPAGATDLSELIELASFVPTH